MQERLKCFRILTELRFARRGEIVFRLANRNSVNILFKRNSVIAQDRLDKMWRVRNYGLLLEILSLLGVAEIISVFLMSRLRNRRDQNYYRSYYLITTNAVCHFMPP